MDFKLNCTATFNSQSVKEFIRIPQTENFFNDGVLHKMVYEGINCFSTFFSFPSLPVSCFLTSYGFKTLLSWKNYHFCRFSKF